MYRELDKYKTGKKVNGIGVLPDKQEMTIKYDQYEFGLGNLMNDFINHKSKPFWKRKNYHNHLTELYIEFLNSVNIITGF